MAGGELFYHLRHQHHFSPDVAKFYAAELLMGLKDLHGLSIIYRDMKPENILLSTKGHLKLADFGLSKVVLKDEKAHSLCGTPEYLAPEVLTSKDGYNMTCDFYSYVLTSPDPRGASFTKCTSATLHFSIGTRQK